MLIPSSEFIQTRNIKLNTDKMCTTTFGNGNRHLRLNKNFGTVGSFNSNVLASESNVVAIGLNIRTSGHNDFIAVLCGV